MKNYESNPYYRWWYSVENAGIPFKTITKYYQKFDEESLFSLSFDDEEYTYPLLTRDDWQWVSSSDQFTFFFNDEIQQTDYQWYYITSSISRMAYASDADSVDTIDEIEEYVWNGDLYTVNIVQNENKKIELIRSDFYSVLSSSEPFIAELNSFLYNNGVSQATDISKIDVEFTDSALPIRDSKANNLKQIVDHSSKTEFPIGGTYPIILKTETGYECLISKRSNEVQSWPEYWTVVPAGYFAPDTIEASNKIQAQFYSEYCEELFNHSEGSVTTNTEKVLEAEEHQNQNKSEFVVTGMSVDALTLSFEVSGVYIVHDLETAKELKSEMDVNYEVDSFEFLDLDDIEKVKKFLSPERITPPSAFAFINALKYLEKELPTDECPKSVQQFID